MSKEQKSALVKITNEFINIRVIQKEFNGEKKRFVNARELHKWLNVGKFFANWINNRIEKYDFTRNTMYEEILLIVGAFEAGLSGEIEKEFSQEDIQRLIG